MPAAASCGTSLPWSLACMPRAGSIGGLASERGCPSAAPTPTAPRDLKSANILCHTLGDEAVLRLCDLGSARQVGPDGGVLVESSPYTTSRSYRGALRGMAYNLHGQPSLTCHVTSTSNAAPELLCGATRYGTAVDVWALACTLGARGAGWLRICENYTPLSHSCNASPQARCGLG